MSGWIKLEKDRRDDPRVLRMARELRNAGVTHERYTNNAHVTLVLGCLDVLWCYADTHVGDDDVLDVGEDQINELVGIKDFCRLMPSDWLEILDANRVKLPDFHAHNGTESRRKAQGQKRSARYRNAGASRGTHKPSRGSVTRASPDQDQTKTRPDHKEEVAALTLAPSLDVPKGLSLEAWDLYLAYRREAKLPSLKPVSIPAAQKQLVGFGPAEVQLEAVKQTIANGWRGLFAPKESINGSHQPKPSRIERADQKLDEWARARGIDPASL